MTIENPAENHPTELQWVLPDFTSKQERGELLRVCRTFSPDNPIALEQRFYDRINEFQVITLTEDLLSKLENTDAGDIAEGDFERVDYHVRHGTYDDPQNVRNWQYLKGKMERGEELDMPVIVKIGETYHTMSGNTRLMVSRALGVMPKVAIVDLTE